MSGSYGGGYGRGGGGGGGYDANFQNRGGGGGGGYGGSGYQSGGRVGVGGGSSGGRGGGDGRDGDWVCPEPSCGNLNFARGVECNKCGAPSPTGGAGSYDKGSATNSYNRDGRDYNNRGRDGDYHGRGRGGHNSDAGRFDGNQGGRAGDYSERGAPYGDNRGTGDYGGGDTAFSSNGGGDNDNFSQVPPRAPAYGGSAVNHPTPPNSYGGHNAYGVESIPQPNSVNSLPPTYGAPSTYGGAPAGYSGPTAGYTDRSIPVLEKGGAPRYGGHGGGYGSAPAEAPMAVKQCDANCGDSCDNSRIYISNLPPDVTTDELRDLFGGIGQVGRIKQKKGYKDQWPWNIKIYTDDHGNSKGDAALCYEDPSAAHSAGGFFNEFDMRGYKINVAMAAKSAPRAPPAYGHGRGRGGYGGGRDRRRDNYRDAGGSGPDRKYHGGQRSQPY